MSVDLKWSEPPSKTSGSTTNKLIAESLRMRPNEWAVIEEVLLPEVPAGADKEDPTYLKVKNLKARGSNRASLIKQGRLKPYAPKGNFDAVSRTEVIEDEDSEYHGRPVLRVYAVYLTEDKRTAVPEAAEPAQV